MAKTANQLTNVAAMPTLTPEWTAAVDNCIARLKEHTWQLADLLYQARHGGFWSEAVGYIRSKGLSRETAYKLKYLAERFPEGQRVKDMSVYFHMSVAGLPVSKARALLQKAKRRQWSNRQVQEAAGIQRSGRLISMPKRDVHASLERRLIRAIRKALILLDKDKVEDAKTTLREALK